MRRAVSLTAALALLVIGCSGPASVPSASPSPAATADIRRAKLDITYSALVDQDVHKVTSKAALQGAIDALRAEVKRTGGTDDFPPLQFQDSTEVTLPDFDSFANAAASFAARNKQITADRFADVAIDGMLGASPDCHTYYVDKGGTVHRSRPEPTSGTAAMVPATGAVLGGPDQIGLIAKTLPGGIVYVTFSEFLISGTYKVTDEVKRMLDKGVGAGAKAWLFDLRGNRGGNGADLMASWFLNGEPTLAIVVKTGSAGTASANKDLRLPSAYQLPIAIVLNNRGGSAPEVFAASLKENKRATVVGQKSVGCLGATSPTQLSDGSLISIASQEFSGAVTGTRYNNNGIVPDVQADDASAVDRAIEVLRARIGA